MSGSPETTWSIDIGSAGWSDLDWVDVGDDGRSEWAGGEAGFRASSHASRWPPALVGMLDTGGPSAHHGFRLAFATGEWLVRTRDRLFDAWTPVPRLLAPIAESWGIDADLHRHHPLALRGLALMLPEWGPVRGSVTSAKELLALLARSLHDDGTRIGRERIYVRQPDLERRLAAQEGRLLTRRLAAADRTKTVEVRDGLLTRLDRAEDSSAVKHRLAIAETLELAGDAPPSELDELLACRSVTWWVARWTDTPPEYRIAGRAARFQAPGVTARVLRTDLMLSFNPRIGPQAAVRLFRLLPPWAMARVCAPEETSMPDNRNIDEVRVFAPDEGTVIDLGSLNAIADIRTGLLSVLRPWMLEPAKGLTRSGMVLRGLQLQGSLSQNTGPPGSVEPDVVTGQDRPTVRITGGAALVPRDGDLFLVEIDSDFEHVEFPEPGDAVLGGTRDRIPPGDWAIVLRLNPARGDDASTVRFARRHLTWEIVVVEGSEYDRDPGASLCLARSIPATRRYDTDLHATWQPDDIRTRWLLDRLGELENEVWLSTPTGMVWSSAVLGREWLRYQAAAAASLQAARMQLSTRPMTTAERVRLMVSLHDRLSGTVSEAASRMLSLFGADNKQSAQNERSAYAKARRGIVAPAGGS